MLIAPSAARDFVWTLIRTDFKARYHATLGGFVWALLKPIGTFVVLLQVFSFLFTDNRYVFDLLIGLLLWGFFGEATSTGLESMLRKGYLLTKATFPRWIVVVAATANATLTLLVYAVAIVVVLLLARGGLGFLNVLLFALYLVQYFLIVVGFSLGTSVLFLSYRDLNQIWEVVLQAGFFVAPIIYPIGTIPERYHFLLYVWPVTPIIQFSREVLVAGTIPTVKAHLMLLGVTAFIFGVGAAIFAVHAPRAVEKL